MSIYKVKKEENMRRRDFIKYAGGGVAALIVGTVLPSWISKEPNLANRLNLFQSSTLPLPTP